MNLMSILVGLIDQQKQNLNVSTKLNYDDEDIEIEEDHYIADLRADYYDSISLTKGF